ncbi:MAG: penicillin-binding protein 2 [Candidatus Curtissbacteria bacterium]|nr:penicillin-binding protein 2 [Candidatus Curtissbacteria bacterium]
MTRLKILQTVIFITAFLIVLRLFYWQFVAKINDVSQTLSQDEIPASRGEIYTSDNFPIVANQEAFLFYGKPKEITSVKETASKLAPLLISEKYATREAQLSDDEKKQKEEEIKKQEESLFSKLSSKSLFWVQLARKVPLATKQKIEALEISGFGFENDEKRFYPEASMGAQFLGFVGSDKLGRDTGYFGLEGNYDSKLRGKPGRLGQDTDPFGLPILVREFRPLSPQKGASLHLSINRSIQFIVEDKLKAAVEKYGAKDGTVIISDPKSGKIIALATYPSYNPANWQEYEENLYKNKAVADTYEPGSTFKLITMSAALDLGMVKPNTKCDVCSGPRQIGGFEISTWNKKYFPDSTMTEVIQHSDNIGMTYVADKLGVDNFYEYINRFGFGKSTNVDLQEESPGGIREKEEWRPIDLATASFGQGIAVTPIQMIQAVGAIANGGKLISPKIVDKIEANGKEEIIKVDDTKQVISPQTAAQITEMMVNAVEKGEAKAFAPKGYRIAGKTGTAQIPVSGHYDPNKTIASFIGFAPANDPKFVMLVRFTEPSSSVFGSETAAPTFFSISKEIFNYYGIGPTEK